MFEHSIPVPRHLKAAANILKQVSTEGGSVKSLLYDKKHRHYNTNVLYALINETIKHSALLEKIFESSQIFVQEPRLEPWLAKILTTELLFGKKTLPGNSKPIQTILGYKEKFDKYLSEHQGDSPAPEVTPKPRYVRINTNLLTTSDAIRYFQDEGYRFIRCTSKSYDDYLNQVRNLTEEDFIQDFHVKTVFVFSPGTKFHDHELYLENKILLQDKATTLAVHLLAPSPGSVVLDMCAAPGMKTTQLAAVMKNEGKIYAVEQNEKRYVTLCEFVEKTGCKSVQTIHKDVLEIRRGDLDDVEYILLDPSCSGSGMEISVHNYVDANRIAKLTSLQEKFLKHAMNAFPKAKRIIYSTCSLHPEENERVVTNIVKTSRVKWRVQDVKELLKGQWNNFGSNMYGSIGTRCLYAKPEEDLTRGFFLAVIDRDFGDNDSKVKENEKSDLDVAKNITKSKESSTHNNSADFNQVDEEAGKEKNKSKRDKRKKEDPEIYKEVNEDNHLNEIDPESNDAAIEMADNPKKRKNKKKEVTAEAAIEAENADSNFNSKKDKKRKHEKTESDSEKSKSRDQTTNSLETNHSKKKKHKNKSESLDETNAKINEVIKIKKKKHKKDKFPIMDTEDVVAFENDFENINTDK